MSDGQEQVGGAATQAQPSEEEMRAAYEAELNRITSSEMILQTAVSLINIAGRRLGLGGPPSPAAAAERDLEQASDAIDGASALLPILERRMPRELGPLRDAIAQLQVAYAREAQSAGDGAPAAAAQAAPSQPATPTTEQSKPTGTEQSKPTGSEQSKPTEDQSSKPTGDEQRPGPAQASGRLWVPGR
ncbi:MAG TPA: hypothetical protein VK781_02035 [Solirubrobacteraceae bacterium]|jgi:hypothetical protein|nr:hypothetical protein [Solirubrobacteraceae bacterium]